MTEHTAAQLCDPRFESQWDDIVEALVSQSYDFLRAQHGDQTGDEAKRILTVSQQVYRKMLEHQVLQNREFIAKQRSMSS